MGTLGLISDRKIKRWPYKTDEGWKIDSLVKVSRRIGTWDRKREFGGTPIDEYNHKYGIKLKKDDLGTLIAMTRRQRRRWCFARKKNVARSAA